MFVVLNGRRGVHYWRSPEFDRTDPRESKVESGIPSAPAVGAEADFISALAGGDLERALQRQPNRTLTALDAADRRVICRRDACGVQPFFYLSRPEFFAFASDPEWLLDLPGVQRKLNPLKAAIYLSGFETDALDSTLTFFDGVFRLPAGHYLIATPGRIEVRRWLKFAPPTPTRATPEELASELRTRVRTAVNRCPPDSALLLSGDTHSAALATIASETRSPDAPLQCWSFVPCDAPGWQWPQDPRPALRRLAQRLPLHIHPVGWADLAATPETDPFPNLKSLPRWFYIYDDEAVAINRARSSGHPHLMTGLGARWLPAYCRPPGASWDALRSGDWKSITRGRTPREIARLIKHDLLVPALPSLLRSPLSRTDSAPASSGQAFLRPEFLERCGFDDWLHEKRRRFTSDFRENALQLLLGGGLQLRLENWALIGASAGVHFHHPFLDGDVIEFSFRLTGAQHLRGDSARIFNSALAGLLPDLIRPSTPRLPAVIDWPLRKVQRHSAQARKLAALRSHPGLAALVDLSPVAAALDRFPSAAAVQAAVRDGDPRKLTALFNPGGTPTSVAFWASFAEFLDRNGFA